LLEHDGTKARALQSESRRQPADSTTYDADAQILHESY
jgi:hypothetical protein